MKDTLIKRKEVLEYLYRLKERLAARLKEKLGRPSNGNLNDFDFFDKHFKNQSFFMIIPGLAELDDKIENATPGNAKACIDGIRKLYQKRQAVADLNFILNKLEPAQLAKLTETMAQLPAVAPEGETTMAQQSTAPAEFLLAHNFSEGEMKLLGPIFTRLGLKCTSKGEGTILLQKDGNDVDSDRSEYQHLSDSGEFVWIDEAKKNDFLKNEEEIAKIRREIIALTTIHQAKEFDESEKKRYEELQNLYIGAVDGKKEFVSESNIVGIIMPRRELLLENDPAPAAVEATAGRLEPQKTGQPTSTPDSKQNAAAAA